MTNWKDPAELRIYNGLHAGARTCLLPGTYVLGSNSHCDIILRDKGIADRHAELRVSGASGNFLQLLPECTDDPGDSIDIIPGKGVSIGPLLIAIESASAPWTNATWRQIESAEAIDFSTQLSPLPAHSEQESSHAAPTLADSARYSTQHHTKRWRSGRLAALLLVGTFGLSSLWQKEGQAPVPASSITIAPDTRRLAQITEVLTSLGMTDRTQVTSLPNGTDLVTALLLSEDEKDSLAAALSRLHPRPGLNIPNETELIQSVIDTVTGKGETLRAEYLGSGNFRVHGYVGSEIARDILLNELASEFPAVRHFEDSLTTPAMMAEKLIMHLKTTGFSDVKGSWSDDLFVLDLVQAPENRLALARSLEQADRKFGRWLKFNIRTGRKNALLPETNDSLPFKIGSVVGGSIPYVVLLTGQKILIGGKFENWILIGVDSEHVVFEGSRRVSIPR